MKDQIVVASGFLDAASSRRRTSPPAKKATKGKPYDTEGIFEINLKRILVPMDFTRTDIKSLAYATTIARLHKAKMIVLHVTKTIALCVDCGYGPVYREEADEAQARKDHSRLRKAVARHVPAALVQDIQIRNGVAADQILIAAEESQSDLIVLYAHATTDPKVMGSHETAERVIRSAFCPVLVVRLYEHDFVQLLAKKK